MKPIAVRGYQDIYLKNIPTDPFILLRPYPTDLIVLYLSKINVILFQEENQSEQSKLIFEKVFLKPGVDHPNYDILVDKLMDHENQIIFSIQSISYLIRTSLQNFKNVEDNLDVNLKTFNKDIFDTILIFNHVVFHTNGTALESLKGIWEIALRQQNYFRDFNALFYTAPVKFTFLDRYLQSFELGREIITEFQNTFQLTHFWDFAHLIMLIIQNVISEKEKGRYILHKSTVHPKLLEQFTSDKSQLKSTLTINIDIIPKPFYEIDNEHIAVLDFNYLRYYLDQGIFWLIYCTTSLKKDKRYNTYNAFRGKIGYEFFEKFLISQLLNSIYNKKHHILIENDSELQDFWVKPNQKELLIIEAKMADLHPLTAENFNTDQFQDFLDKNYKQSKISGNKSKGVFQLVKQIENLFENQLVSFRLRITNLKNINILPVIVYSDPILDVAGVNNYINEAFLTELKNMQVNTERVRPITMVNASILIDHYNEFVNCSISFSELITDYQDYIRKKEKNYIKNKSPYSFYETNISFADWTKQKLGMSKEKAMKNLDSLKRFYPY